MKLTVCCVYTSVQFFVVKMAKSAPTYSSQTDLKSFVTKHVLVFIYQSSSLYCLVTEFAAGGDLLSFVRGQRDGRLGEVSARRFVRQLVSALHHMHDRGVVHRYVPPPSTPPSPTPNYRCKRTSSYLMPDTSRMQRRRSLHALLPLPWCP